ncbi:MAG: site-specific DNA-methyltransferase [Bdellovibrionales bacterium]|nr:site-specific DNA-methyltransferase [Bdellovibrionales bacterium]
MPVLKFKGKSTVYSHHLGVPFRSLEIDEKKSLSKGSKNRKKDNSSLNDNLIIHGDNLHALKALLPRYTGKVKCIYIDPPYNTGNEGWKYNDNVNSPAIQKWLKQNGIGTDDLERHDKWLCMMWPRLQLLKELLSDDGVIFISIDDNECYNLKKICDEIFGIESFINCLTILCNPKGRSQDKYFATNHEYVLVFSKNPLHKGYFSIEKSKSQISSEYLEIDEHGAFRLLELRNTHREFGKHNRKNLYYPLYASLEGTVDIKPDAQHINKILPLWDDGFEGCWTWEKGKVKKDKTLLFAKKTNGKWKVYRKNYANGAKKMLKTILQDNLFYTEKGQKVFNELFQTKDKIFQSPKSPYLIKELIKTCATKNSIILDSFAGSGTTAQAVLDLNKEDGGHRKFILVECEDYADKITAERVRRVIKGVPKVKDEKLKKGLGGSFTYCTLGKEINEENLIKGKSLPSYKVLSSYVYYIATGQTLNKVHENEDFYIGKSAKNTAFFIVYKPNIKFLRSRASALNLDRKEEIQKIMKVEDCKKAVVFAPVHYFDSAEELAKEGIIFCQLPFSIYKIAGV